MSADRKKRITTYFKSYIGYIICRTTNAIHKYTASGHFSACLFWLFLFPSLERPLTSKPTKTTSKKAQNELKTFFAIWLRLLCDYSIKLSRNAEQFSHPSHKHLNLSCNDTYFFVLLKINLYNLLYMIKCIIHQHAVASTFFFFSNQYNVTQLRMFCFVFFLLDV